LNNFFFKYIKRVLEREFIGDREVKSGDERKSYFGIKEKIRVSRGRVGSLEK
jgi:hypothetical protein